MRCAFMVPVVLSIFLVGSALAQENPAEPKVESKVESIGLFKNGLAVVRRTVDLPGPGKFRLDDVPALVHGTFWITSPVPVAVTLTSREVDGPPRGDGGINFQEQLVGKQVSIHFREGTIPAIEGKVIEVARANGDQAWNRSYQQPEYSPYYYQGRPINPQGTFLLLDSASGRIYVDSGLIAYLAVKEATVKQRQPVLLLSSEATDDGKSQPVHVTITYLTKGIAWAPAYRVNLDDPKTLTIQQQAVVKNEMKDFKDAELQLISGFPSIQFAHVTSPMSLDTNWASFFTQLAQRISPDQGLMSNMAQQSVSSRSVSDPSVDLSATPMGEGVDLHYQSIGKRSMMEGDSLMLTTGQGKAPYERIVEWTVPDTRDAYGRPADWRDRSNEVEKNQDTAWDAVRFKNPLPFPMTTAPALVTAAGQFNGQRQSLWVNIGEQTTLQITKALSVRTRSTEEEDQTTGREIIHIGGREYRKVTVKGELQVSNHRKEAVTLVIRRQFSGDMLKADGNPTVTLSEEGVYSVNKRNVLNWSLTLPAGEAKTITYQYVVLVIN